MVNQEFESSGGRTVQEVRDARTRLSVRDGATFDQLLMKITEENLSNVDILGLHKQMLGMLFPEGESQC